MKKQNNEYIYRINEVLGIMNLPIPYGAFETGDELADWLENHRFVEFDEPMDKIPRRQRSKLNRIYEEWKEGVKLLNISNHPSEKWDKEQREGFSEIIDISFPNVDPTWSEKKVVQVASHLYDQIKETGVKNIMLQGEFSLVFALQQILMREGEYSFYFPTTERIVEEKEGVKTSIFKFVRWRIL